MKKTWKERLYYFCELNFKYHFDLVFALLGFVCFVVGIFIDYERLKDIFAFLTLFLPIFAFYLSEFCDVMTNYNKETFLCNKVRTVLFANKSFCGWTGYAVFILTLKIAHVIIERYPSIERIVMLFCSIVCSILIIIIINFSEYCKKKIVHIDTDN